MGNKVEVNLENCVKYPEIFGKRLCDVLGWHCFKKSFYTGTPSKWQRCWAFTLPNGVLEYKCAGLSASRDLISVAEESVIKTVAEGEYGRKLWQQVTKKPLDNLNWNDLSKIAKAGAESRLIACLLSFGIVEIEVTEEKLELYFKRNGGTIQPNGIRRAK